MTHHNSPNSKVVTGDGGVAWPIYAAGYGPFHLTPFARSGATCSNNLTSRPFPSLFESQLPLFFAETANKSLKLDAEKTIFTLWIGTNDVGANALLTGGQKEGVTVVDTVDCAVNWVRTLYKAGARNFLFQNVSFFVSTNQKRVLTNGFWWLDDPIATYDTILRKLIPQSILERPKKHDRMERLHDRTSVQR